MTDVAEALSETGVVRLYKAYEPRLDIKADRDFIAVMGAANISTRPYAADSASTGQIIWSQTTPSVRVGVDRLIELDCEVEVSVSISNPPAGAVTWNWKDFPNVVKTFGPRQYPLHSICEVVQLRLNDQSFSWEPSQILHPLLEYGLTQEDRQYHMGSSAHYPDQQWRYPGGDGNQQRGVFSTWMNSTFEDSRNLGNWATGFTLDAVPIANSKTFNMRMIEQMMLSPLAYADQVQCLFGIQNLDIALTFKSPLERMFSGDPYALILMLDAAGDEVLPAAGTTVNFSFNFPAAKQLLHITYLQPQINERVPWRINYPYWQIQKFEQNVGTLINPRDTFEVIYNNVTLHQIPKRLLLFSCPNVQSLPVISPAVVGAASRAQDAIDMANFCAAIDKITINFDTQDGRFSTLTSFDLYKIAQKNGYKRSYLSWSQFLGSVLAIEFGVDMNLSPLLAPSVRGNFQLAATVNYRDVRDLRYVEDVEPGNNNAPTFENQLQYKAYMIIINTGIVSIQNQLVTTSIGSATEIQVEQAPWLEEGFRRDMRYLHGEGSLKNIFHAARKFAKSASHHISPVADVIASVAGLSDDPRAQAASKVANIVGKVAKSTGRGRATGGRRTGGQRVSAHSLSRRL